MNSNTKHRAQTLLALGETAFMIDATADDFAEDGLDLGATAVGPVLIDARLEVEAIARGIALRGERADKHSVHEAEGIIRAIRRALDLAARERDPGE